MEIIWHGGSSVELKQNKTRCLLNPDAKADLKNVQVLVYDQTSDKHSKPEDGVLVDWPGEYDTAGFSFRGIEVHEGKKTRMAYTFHTNEGNIAWMGEMKDYPDKEFIEQMGEVHVLLVPVGGDDVMKAKDAFRLVEALEPMVVIPICYGDKRDGLSAFLKEMDVKLPEAQKSYAVKKSVLGSTQMELVILGG